MEPFTFECTLMYSTKESTALYEACVPRALFVNLQDTYSLQSGHPTEQLKKPQLLK